MGIFIFMVFYPNYLALLLRNHIYDFIFPFGHFIAQKSLEQTVGGRNIATAPESIKLSKQLKPQRFFLDTLCFVNDN